MWPFIYVYLFMQTAFSATTPEQYLIYHVNNTVTWLHDGVKEQAKRGVFIKPTHALQLANHAEAMLIGADGRSMLLKTPGRFTFQQLKQRFRTQHNQTVVSAFFAYVFEKFLMEGQNAGTKQKVAASVFRSEVMMQIPADSSLVTELPVKMSWKGNPSIPYILSKESAGKTADTLLRKSTTFNATADWLGVTDKPALVRWKVYPADSKQADAIAGYLFLIPATTDRNIVEQQLQQLRSSYAREPKLLRMMEKDLFRRWMELYQL